MPLDLSFAHNRKMLAERIKADIDEYCVRTYDDGPRSHLGASLIGHDCNRYLQYVFRHFNYKIVDGRMQRLFQRGHLEEHRFVEYLRGIGFTVWQFEDETTEKQFVCAAVGGHYGGALDSIMQTPDRYDCGDLVFLGEFKTNGTGKKFAELKAKGVAFAKSQHFDQASVYGWFRGIKYGVYLSVNKNDDDLHVEVIELDWARAEDSARRAQTIIMAKHMMPRLSESETYYICKSCDMLGVCHQQHKPMQNCRSCRFSTPIDGAQWRCEKYGVIPKEFIPKGCPEWQEFGKEINSEPSIF